MQSNRKIVYLVLLSLVFVVLFNVFFYSLCGTDNKSSVWISYAFIHVAYLLLALTPLVVRSGKSRTILGASLFAVGFIYFYAELIYGVAFIAIAPESWLLAFLTQLLPACGYAFIVFANLLANEDTTEREAVRAYARTTVKSMVDRVSALLGRSQDKEANRAIERAYDALRSMPVMAHGSFLSLDDNLNSNISQLELAVTHDASKDDTLTIAQSIKELAEKRTEQSRLLGLQ